MSKFIRIYTSSRVDLWAEKNIFKISIIISSQSYYNISNSLRINSLLSIIEWKLSVAR